MGQTHGQTDRVKDGEGKGAWGWGGGEEGKGTWVRGGMDGGNGFERRISQLTDVYELDGRVDRAPPYPIS